MIDTYTKLLESAAELADEKKKHAVVEKLVMHLKSNGRVKMLSQIANELKKIDARRTKMQPVLEVASEKEVHAAHKGAEEAGLPTHKAHINHALIRGWRVKDANRLVDHSAKRALIDIYKKVI